MKRVVQAIAIASDPMMKLLVMTGEKTITIREGHRDFSEGPVVLFDETDSWVVKAEIVEVNWVRLCDVTKKDWEADGFASQEEMLSGMQQFYPSMTLKSPVTVVRWRDVSGYWVDKNNMCQFALNHNIL